MKKNFIIIFCISFLCQAQNAFAQSPKISNDITISSSVNSTITNEDILKATVSIYVTQILGWYYNANQSPVWRRGSHESAKVGEKGEPKRKNVRAVCLGEEKNKFVFFTLRSFVDPSFPNPFIQGLTTTPLGKDGQSVFSESSSSTSKITRYGDIDFTWYKDCGGGDLRVEQQVCVSTHADMDTPKDYGSIRYLISTEKIDNVIYERPHEKVSASAHLAYRSDFQNGLNATIKFFEDHDVALVYVPKKNFPPEYSPPNLGIKNPTLVSELFLNYNKEIFGFKFVLMGQETMDSIKNYIPPKITPAEMSGFEKLFLIAGNAMSPETIATLKHIDSVLNSAIPDEILFATDKDISQTALSIVSNLEILKKLKSLLDN
ncbi:MAG: hypothetical protein HQM08_28090 [Candidatus Riflebacteria bacterium]|nr:hypothetical protein [Candidatus Riflebacteria bacterium]